MNKIIASFLILLVTTGVWAQNHEYTFTEVLGKEDNQIVKAVFENNYKTFIIKRIEDNKTDFVLDILDSSNKFIVSYPFQLPVSEIKKMGVVQGKLVVFGVLEEGTTDVLKLFNIDDETGAYEEKTLSTIKARGGYRTEYDVSISPNGKYFSMIGSQAYEERHKEIINIAIYDSLQNEVYSDDMLTNLESSKRRYNVLVCNNNGLNYIVKKDRVKNKNNYYVFTISKSGEQEYTEVRLRARQIVDAEYALDVNGYLYLVGFYSSPMTFNFEGLFMAKFQETSSATFTKEYLLNANVIETFKSKKEIKDYGYGLDFFSSKNLVFSDDKNMMFMAEHHSVIKDGKNGPEDYRKGFVLFNLDVNGGFRFSTPVITEQTDGTTMGYWSSAYLLNNSGNPIVYLNRIGDGAKSAKSSEQKNSGVPIEVLVFKKSGAYESAYPQFEMPLSQYCLNSDFKNKTTKTIVCFESLDRKAFTFGILKPTDE